MIRKGAGNLLKADAEALVNTVNCAGVMGKGIALQFKQAWPEMFRAYQAAVRAGEVQPGRMHVWPTGNLENPRFIINFPTKRHWKGASKIEDIDAGLLDLVKKLRDLEVSSVAIPPLGAGNGGLDWTQVRPKIVAAIGPMNIDAQLWDPGDAPAVATRPINTDRPDWTPERAAVVALMGQYRVLDDELTQIEVQKLAYFLQESGYNLRLRYSKQHYGPYADELYHLLQKFEGHYIRGLEDRSPNAELLLNHDAVREALSFVACDEALFAKFSRVSRLIEGFETPYGMELLATVHCVAKADATARVDAEAALAAVKRWSARKRSMMKPTHVRIAWERLHQLGWLEDAAA